MKRLFIPLVVIVFLIAVSLGVFTWWRVNSQPVSGSPNPQRFVIQKGRSASQIGEALFSEQLIKNPLLFKVYVQVTGKEKKIQSGQYSLSPNLNLPQVVRRLTSGPEELWVTIPEGLRREEIVEKFKSGLEMDANNELVFRQEFLAESKDFEGFLFPDTYLFPREVTASQVVRKLRNTFDSKVESLRKDIETGDYTENELITLASIIERETKKDNERPIVAGILFNRLEIGMVLQADATVQYAVANSKLKIKQSLALQAQNSKLDKWWEPLIKDDLEINSPYNTYKFSGLPPAPIANPGLSSIQAVVNPVESDYWYYIHDPEGNIHYARSLEEHNQNIRNFLD